MNTISLSIYGNEIRLMNDHPGWIQVEDGRQIRVMNVERDDSLLSVSFASGKFQLRYTSTNCTDSGPTDLHRVVDPKFLKLEGPNSPTLVDLSPIVRVRTICIWEAAGTAIIRQIIRAQQARDLYHRFCRSFGQRIEVDGVQVWCFPSAKTVVDLSTEDFVSVGLKLKKDTLVETALWYLNLDRQSISSRSNSIYSELLAIRGVGPWTAGAAFSDFTNNFDYYPYTDLAVRARASYIAPSLEWEKSDKGFARQWREFFHDSLGEATMLVLAQPIGRDSDGKP